jgi:hypothetical protein
MDNSLIPDASYVPPSPAFFNSHPELHHYTTFVGFEGIIKSQSLWASHFSDLNDSSEVMLIREPLSRAVAARFAKMVKDTASLRLRRSIEKIAGSQAGLQGAAKNWSMLLSLPYSKPK